MRVLILIAVLYLGYRYLKSRLTAPPPRGQSAADDSARRIDDVMIRDPFCNVYFPKRNGVRLTVDGTDLFFCSEECRERYLAERSKPKTG